METLVVEVLNWLGSTDDDLIGNDIIVINSEWLRRYSQRSLTKYENTDLDHHISTSHTKSGKYIATFKIMADKEPLNKNEVEGILHTHVEGTFVLSN